MHVPLVHQENEANEEYCAAPSGRHDTRKPLTRLGAALSFEQTRILVQWPFERIDICQAQPNSYKSKNKPYG
jgi:hypothetical protein